MFIRSWTTGIVGSPGVPILQCQVEQGLGEGEVDPVVATAMDGTARHIIMDYVNLQFAVLGTCGSTSPPAAFDVGQVSGRGS